VTGVYRLVRERETAAGADLSGRTDWENTTTSITHTHWPGGGRFTRTHTLKNTAAPHAAAVTAYHSSSSSSTGRGCCATAAADRPRWERERERERPSFGRYQFWSHDDDDNDNNIITHNILYNVSTTMDYYYYYYCGYLREPLPPPPGETRIIIVVNNNNNNIILYTRSESGSDLVTCIISIASGRKIIVSNAGRQHTRRTHYTQLYGACVVIRPLPASFI